MFLRSIVNRCPGLGCVRVPSFYCCSSVQSCVGLGVVLTAALKGLDSIWDGRLFGGGAVLLVQAVIQQFKAIINPQFSLNCKRISCLALAILINGEACGYAISLPAGGSNGAMVVVGGLVISFGIANAEDLVHCCCSENRRYEEIPPIETGSSNEIRLSEHPGQSSTIY